MAVQHIRLLQNKRQTLADALVGAELQFLAELRREYDAGQTTWRGLRDAYATLAAGRLRGLEARWMDAIGVSLEKVVANARWEKLGIGEVWKGHWPLHRGSGSHLPDSASCMCCSTPTPIRSTCAARIAVLINSPAARLPACGT